MNGPSDLFIRGRLPIGGLTFLLIPLTFLSALQADAEGASGAPQGVEPSTWAGIVELSYHVAELGPGGPRKVTATELLMLHSADAKVLLQARDELRAREARFLSAAEAGRPGGGGDGEGDGVVGGGDPVAADGRA